jgi:predicted naringenin-chalcone synthase
VANALFSDGAAAIVACAGSMATGDGDTSFLASGSTRIDQSREMMTWKIGDHGFEMTLSPQVPDLLRKHLRGWLVDWLGGMGLSLADIASWAIHPGGPRILSACAETLGLTPEAMAPSREVLGEFGNMSSPTVLFIVERLRRAGAPKPWVVLGFGPGLAIEAVLLGESGR